MTFKQWIFALIDSILSGVALAVLTYFVIPQNLPDLATAIKKLWIVAVGGAIIGLFNHLRQSPISKITAVFVGALMVSMILFLPMACAVGPKIAKSTCVWDANTEVDLAGYYLYWRTPTGTFQDANRTPVVKSTAPTFSLLTLNLSPGQYVIAVSAYNTAGNESGMSNEVTWDAAYPGNPKNAIVK